jgi:hypothetical protein
MHASNEGGGKASHGTGGGKPRPYNMRSHNYFCFFPLILN